MKILQPKHEHTAHTTDKTNTAYFYTNNTMVSWAGPGHPGREGATTMLKFYIPNNQFFQVECAEMYVSDNTGRTVVRAGSTSINREQAIAMRDWLNKFIDGEFGNK